MNRAILEANYTFKEILSFIRTGFDDYTVYDNASKVELFNGNLGANSLGGKVDFLLNIGDRVMHTAVEVESNQVYLSLLFAEWDETNAQFVLTDLAAKLMQTLIMRFADSYCARLIYSDDYEEELTLKAKHVASTIFTILQNTYEKYEVLYNAYQEKKDVLLDRLKVESNVINRYNDTPQGEGDFSDDEHTSDINITKGETATDNTTPIERIAEIDRKMKNLFIRWSNEFVYLFWEE